MFSNGRKSFGQKGVDILILFLRNSRTLKAVVISLKHERI